MIQSSLNLLRASRLIRQPLSGACRSQSARRPSSCHVPIGFHVEQSVDRGRRGWKRSNAPSSGFARWSRGLGFQRSSVASVIRHRVADNSRASIPFVRVEGLKRNPRQYRPGGERLWERGSGSHHSQNVFSTLLACAPPRVLTRPLYLRASLQVFSLLLELSWSALACADVSSPQLALFLLPSCTARESCQWLASRRRRDEHNPCAPPTTHNAFLNSFQRTVSQAAPRAASSIPGSQKPTLYFEN